MSLFGLEELDECEEHEYADTSITPKQVRREATSGKALLVAFTSSKGGSRTVWLPKSALRITGGREPQIWVKQWLNENEELGL